MAIQFNCTNCGQPIEVDDEHANRSAACPYCRVLVTVPAASTLTPGQPTPARPAGPPPGSPFPPPPGAYPFPPVPPQADERQRAAASWGNYALISGLLAMVLGLVVFLVLMGVTMRFIAEHPTSQPSQEEFSAAMQEEIQQKYAWVGVLIFGGAIFGLIAIALAATSLFYRTRGNWRAYVALALGAPCFGCTCIMFLAEMIAGVARG